jgi:hypothetical protein
LDKTKGIKEQLIETLTMVIWIKERKESKSGIMSRLTLKSSFQKIWYGSRGLHLLGEPICIIIDLVALGRIFKALSQLTQTRYNTRQFHLKEEGLIFKTKARLPSTLGLPTRFGTMGTTSPRLRDKGTWGPTISQPTRPEDLGQEARCRGDLRDIYR